MDRGGQAAQKATTTCDLNGTSIPYAIERGNLAELRNAMQSSGDELSFSDLENVEKWLYQVYGLLCVEPDRSWMATAILPETHSSREPSSDDSKPCIRHRVPPSCPFSDNATLTDNGIANSGCAPKPEPTMEEDSRYIGTKTKMSTSQTLNFVVLMHSVDCEVGTTDDRDVSSRLASCDLDSILDELMSVSEELEVKSSHAKDAIAHIRSTTGSLGCGESTQARLQAHLAYLSGALDPLKGRLSHRIAQLKFEKFQKAVLDELTEVQCWIDSKLKDLQPQAQSHETEELIVIAEQYRTRLEMQWKDLDTVSGQLFLFCHEDMSMLDCTIQQLRNVYHETISRLSNSPLQLADVSSNTFDAPYNCDIYFRIPIMIGLFSLICTILVIYLESVAHATH